MSGGGFGDYNPSYTNNPNQPKPTNISEMPTNHNGEAEKKEQQGVAGIFGFDKKDQKGEVNGSPMKTNPSNAATGATANSGLFSSTPVATSGLFGSNNSWGRPGVTSTPSITTSATPLTASPMKKEEEKAAATAVPAFGFSPFKPAAPATISAPSFGSFGASPAKPVTSTPFGFTASTEPANPVFSGFGAPKSAAPATAEKKVEEHKPAFGGISSTKGTPRKSSFEGKETPSKPAFVELKEVPRAAPAPVTASPRKPSVESLAPVTASPRRPSLETATVAPVTASPRKPALETLNKPAQFTASPRKPSVEAIKPIALESPKSAAVPKPFAAPKPAAFESPKPVSEVFASPRKAAVDAGATNGTPRKSSLETPRRPSHESLQQTPKPVVVPAAAPTPFVTPQRDPAAKLKEQSASAAILGQALSQPASAAKAVSKPVEKHSGSEFKAETPKKTHRSESIDDSWVKIDKEEVLKPEIKKDEVKEKEAAPASPKMPRTPKAAAKPVAVGSRRTSSRARQAPSEIPMQLPVNAGVAKKTTELPAGSGTKLVDIPHVAGMLTKKKVSDKTLLIIHRLIFGRPGEANKRKGDLRQFNGFPTSFDHASLDKKIQSQTLPALRDLCIFFNLERSGEKSAVAARLLDFIVSPKDQGASKSVQAKKVIGKKKAAPALKGKASSAKKAKTTGKKANGLSPETVESEDDYADEIASLKAGANKQ